MKKILVLVLCLAFTLVPICSSFAAGVDGWEVNSGYTLGNDTWAHEISQTDEGLVVYSEAGYWGKAEWGGEGNAAGFSGMRGGAWQTAPLANSDELTIKFRFDKCSQGREKADNSGLEDADQWFSVQLLSGPTFMDFDNRAEGTGLNVLVRPQFSHPDGAMIQFQPHLYNDVDFKNDNDTTAWMCDPIGKEVTMKITKNAEGKWDVYGTVDGTETKATAKASIDQPILGDNVYLALGLSNNWKEEMQVTVLEINGVSQAAAPAETEAPGDDVPQTGQDYTWAIVLGSLAVLLAGVGAIMLINKSRKSA